MACLLGALPVYMSVGADNGWPYTAFTTDCKDCIETVKQHSASKYTMTFTFKNVSNNAFGCDTGRRVKVIPASGNLLMPSKSKLICSISTQSSITDHHEGWLTPGHRVIYTADIQ